MREGEVASCSLSKQKLAFQNRATIWQDLKKNCFYPVDSTTKWKHDFLTWWWGEGGFGQFWHVPFNSWNQLLVISSFVRVNHSCRANQLSHRILQHFIKLLYLGKKCWVQIKDYIALPNSCLIRLWLSFTSWWPTLNVPETHELAIQDDSSGKGFNVKSSILHTLAFFSKIKKNKYTKFSWFQEFIYGHENCNHTWSYLMFYVSWANHLRFRAKEAQGNSTPAVKVNHSHGKNNIFLKN